MSIDLWSIPNILRISFNAPLDRKFNHING